MLWSLNFYQQFSGEVRSSLETSYQLLQLAEDLKDGALTMEAHRSIGATRDIEAQNVKYAGFSKFQISLGSISLL